MAKPKPKPGSITLYNMRFPTDLKNLVADVAYRNGRSLNAEIVMALRERYAKPYQNGISSFSVDAPGGTAVGDVAGESAGSEA